MGILNTSRFFLRIWGMWPFEFQHNSLKIIIYKIYRFIIVGWYSIFNISQTIAFIRLIIEEAPLERITNSCSVLVTLILMLINSFLYEKNKIPALCLKVFNHEEEVLMTMSESDEDIGEIYKGTLKNNKNLNIYVVGSSISTLIAFIGISFQIIHASDLEDWKSGNVTFMHELYIPFDKERYQFLIFSLNIFTACESVVVNGVIQTTFYALVMFASLRFKIIQIRLKNLTATSGSSSFENLKEILKDHNESIEFVEELNYGTKYVLLLSFLLNSVKVASVLFPLMAVNEISELTFPLIYSSMLISEVFFMGWICNEVKEQSIKITDNLYNVHNWYNEDKNFKFIIKMMLMRAQKPVTVKIGPFGPMTTDTIVATMKGAYSYATLMMKNE